MRALAVILGGGCGKRLYPLTKYRSKPAVPFAGKYRLIDVPISNCIYSHLNRIYVLTQFNSESLNKHIATTYRFDAFSGGFVQIIAAEQTPDKSEWFQGTADAVRQSFRHFRSYDVEDIVILSGDQLYSMDLADFLVHHRAHKADITVACKPMNLESSFQLGIMSVDHNGCIGHFLEKPAPDALPESMLFHDAGQKKVLASMGIYIFKKHVLEQVLTNNKIVDFGSQVIPNALAQYRVVPYIFKDYWEDIGTIRSFYDANLLLTSPCPPFNFYNETRPLYTHARFLPASKIGNCQIQNSSIADGCIIEGAYVENSIIGLRSVIREGCRIRNSVLMGADYYEFSSAQQISNELLQALGIGKNCVIENAIIDKNVRIGENTRIVNSNGITDYDGPNYQIVDGIVVVEKNAFLPAGTVI